MNSSNAGAAITDSEDWVEESLEENQIKVPSHEDVLLYLQEQRYRQECTKNEKRNIRRKAKRYALEDGALLYTKKDKTKVALSVMSYRSIVQCHNAAKAVARFKSSQATCTCSYASM